MKRVRNTRSSDNGTKHKKSDLTPGSTSDQQDPIKKEDEDNSKMICTIKNDKNGARNIHIKPKLKAKIKSKPKQQKCKNSKIYQLCKSTSGKLTPKKTNVVKTSSLETTSDQQITSKVTFKGNLLDVDKLCDSKNKISISPKPLYSELCTKEYAINDYKCIDLDFLANVVCEINDTIWCGGQSIIHVYSNNGELLGIYTNDIQGVYNIVKVNDNLVIVACANGLHQIELTSDSLPGEYQSLLTIGSFSGACIYGENLYAVEYFKRRIIVFKQKNKKWNHFRNIKIYHSYRQPFDQLFIHDGLIYVGCRRDKYIHVYNLQGQFQHQRGKSSDKGSLCGIDHSGNLLLAEHNSTSDNGLAVYDTDGCRHEVKLFPEENNQWVLHAAIDTQANIWVACYNKKLFKFTQK